MKGCTNDGGAFTPSAKSLVVVVFVEALDAEVWSGDGRASRFLGETYKWFRVSASAALRRSDKGIHQIETTSQQTN
jgi:hypothetical protein